MSETKTNPVTATEWVRLRSEQLVGFRPIRPDDAPKLQSLFERLSPESVFLRFLGSRKTLTAQDAERLANVDYDRRMAFVATLDEGPEEILIGVARYSAVADSEPLEAEAAIIVEDSYQSQGLGTLMLERLSAYARQHGVHRFWAAVHHSNDRILRFLRHSGLPLEMNLDDGVWDIHVSLDPEPKP